MIGNDVVDLEATVKYNTILRPGFLDKIFLEEEKDRILGSENKAKTTWLFWAMKEAAYKAHQRRFQLPRSYQPKSLVCKLIEEFPTSGKGEVRIENYTYATANITGDFYIHSIATSLQHPEIFHEIHATAANCKEALVKQISGLKNLAIKDLKIIKDTAGVPHIYYKNTNLKIPFSLSHHGNFSAFTFALMKY